MNLKPRTLIGILEISFLLLVGLMVNSLSTKEASANSNFLQGTVMIIASDLKIKSSIIFASSSQHGSPISLLRWNPSGKRLVSGDKVSFLSRF